MLITSHIRRNPKTHNLEYRRVIPRGLRELIGKSEVKYSFGAKVATSSIKTRCLLVAYETDRLIEEARARVKAMRSNNLKIPTLLDIATVLADYRDAQLKAFGGFTTKVALMEYIKPFDVSLLIIKNDRVSKHAALYDELGARLQDVFNAQGFVIEDGSVQQAEVLDTFKKHLERLVMNAIKMTFNNFDGLEITGLRPLIDKQPKASSEKSITLNPELQVKTRKERKNPQERTIQELFDTYIASLEKTKEGTKGARKGIGEKRSKIAAFISSLEFDESTYLVDIEIEEAANYKELLFRQPHLRKLERYHKDCNKLPLKEQVELGMKHDVEAISSTTANNNCKAVSAMFSHGIKLGWLKDNPFVHVVRSLPKASHSRTSEEKTYDNEDLKKIFTGDIFIPKGKELWRTVFGEATYWIPLIAYYSGARVEELAQLDTDDITEEGEFYYIHIRANKPDKSVKTNEARKVPIHPDLIALGLIQYTNSITQSAVANTKQVKLFPKLSQSSTAEKYSIRVAKSLAKRYRSQYGVRNVVAPSHGFRHSFRAIAREPDLGMQEGYVNQITGHSDNSEGAKYGTYKMIDTYKTICKFPSLENIGELIKYSPHNKGY